jgi:hypothetical protein
VYRFRSVREEFTETMFPALSHCRQYHLWERKSRFSWRRGELSRQHLFGGSSRRYTPNARYRNVLQRIVKIYLLIATAVGKLNMSKRDCTNYSECQPKVCACIDNSDSQSNTDYRNQPSMVIEGSDAPSDQLGHVEERHIPSSL